VLPKEKAAIEAPCTPCPRHGDPIRAKKRLTSLGAACGGWPRVPTARFARLRREADAETAPASSSASAAITLQPPCLASWLAGCRHSEPIHHRQLSSHLSAKSSADLAASVATSASARSHASSLPVPGSRLLHSQPNKRRWAEDKDAGRGEPLRGGRCCDGMRASPGPLDRQLLVG
jgi:hypothetical protein